MKLVILEPLGVEQEKLLALAEEKLTDRVEIEAYDTRVTDADALAERAKDADIVVLSNLPFRREVMERCPNLKMISVAFTGVDHVDMDYCRERGILVSNCAGYSNTAVSELVFGLALSLYRRIIECDRAVRAGKDKTGLVGLELAGKTFGIIGMGANRSPKQVEGVRMVELDELLRESDIVSLHVPLTEQTRGMIGEREIGLMKPSAILINTARGPVVDSAALAAALKEGRLAGAAVDVYETEPPIPQDHPLLSAPHVAATPHVAFATKEALYQRAVIVFDNVAGYLDGKPQNVM